MFFQESAVNSQESTRLPQELVVSALRYVSRAKRLEARHVCREMRDDIDNCGLVWEDAGAANRADFIERMKKLPSKYQDLILSGGQYTFPVVVAMRVADILALPVAERAQALFTPAQIAAMPAAIPQVDDYIWCLINKERGITALCEGLVTPEQIAQMPNAAYVLALISKNGIMALREKLFTPEQFSAEPSLFMLINHSNGVRALRERLITLAEVIAMPISIGFWNEIDARLFEAEALKANSQKCSHWKKNGNGFLGRLPRELIANVLVYSRDPEKVSLHIAKEIVSDAMKNPHPGPRP